MYSVNQLTLRDKIVTTTNDFLLLTRGKLNKIIGPLSDSAMREARKNFYLSGYITVRVGKPPAERTLRRWKQLGKMKMAYAGKSWGSVMESIKLYKQSQKQNRLDKEM